MRSNSSSEQERGAALRLVGLLQTKASGTGQTLRWTRAFRNREDQACALLGVAQALLKIDDVKLSYSAILIH
jgi:hypothetical protein